VIGALILRELHTRYGRENIGYLWMIGEPMLLASVMALLHHSGHTQFGSDVKALPFTVLGYTTFIMFRGIVNRSEGTIESNAPLLYHRMVTVFDVATARALLEGAGTFLTYVVLMTLLCASGLTEPPARPLELMLAEIFMLWMSWSQSLIVVGISHENKLAERLVHPYSYFMIPLSGAFFQVEWLPEPYRSLIVWLPLPHIFELARYGQFHSANLRYFDGFYLVSWCVVLTWCGLIATRRARRKVHLH
jgi:capsular polysaccharide transport system permease protein